MFVLVVSNRLRHSFMHVRIYSKKEIYLIMPVRPAYMLSDFL